MARQSSFGSLVILALVLCAIAAAGLMVLFTPNQHATEKHPDATWLFDESPSDAQCYGNETKKLYLFPFLNPCGRQKAGGVITTADGDTITAFVADLAYWLKVIARDGYQ